MNDPKKTGRAEGVRAGGSYEALEGLRVLVVDDDPVVRMLVRQILKRVRSVVETASSGVDALDLLEREPFDLVVTDIEMPGIDGIALARFVRNPRSNVRSHDLPILALTALGGEEMRARCMDAGMNEFIVKPIRVRELLGAIRRHAPKGR
ncbi:MAG: response regulator [Candidatus Eisenbacteria bacterium]|nr:response regulator [Candidatus Eisenbacteria bacterium]